MKHLHLSIILSIIWDLGLVYGEKYLKLYLSNLHLSRNITHFLADSMLADFLQPFCSFVAEIINFKMI